MPTFDGPDVSHYQGAAFPWQWIADQGCRFGACKMTEGTGFVDSTGAHNRDAMKAVGLRWRGLYHYARAGDPVANAQHFANEVGDIDDGEFVFLDVESGMTPEVGAVVAMLEAFEELYPGRVADYQGKYFASGDSSAYLRWPWILPAYPWPVQVMPPTARPVMVWQYAGGAHGVDVPGVGRVDSNMVINAKTLDAVCAVVASPLPTSPPVVVPPLLPPTFTQTQPVGRVPLYTEETAMADPYRITSPQYQTQLLRWPSGALGWCSHAEAAKYPTSVEEGDPATFLALVGACTVPPVPQGQVIPT